MLLSAYPMAEPRRGEGRTVGSPARTCHPARMKRLLLLLPLVGCTDQPSHIPNPLFLPAQAVGSAVQNASYDARRGRVENHVITNHSDIVSEIEAGGGPMLSLAMELAWITAPKRPALTALLARDIALYRDDPEALIVALMVHGA